MLKLIQNEFIKIFSKKSTIIMLIILLLMPIGYQALMKMAEKLVYSYSEAQNEDTVKQEIEWMEQDPEMKDSYQLALLNAELRLGVFDAYSYYDNQSWQGSLLQDAYGGYYYASIDEDNSQAEDAKAIIAAAEEAIKTGNYKYYYDFLIITDGDSNSKYCQFYKWLQDHDVVPDSDSWEFNLVSSCEEYMYTVDSYDSVNREHDDTYEKAENQLDLCQYRLDNGIENCVTDYGTLTYDEDSFSTTHYSFSSDFWSNMYSMASLITVVTTLMVIIAGAMIAGEYSGGTIKFLLINPVSRTKIFFSKYITLLLMTLLTTAVLFVSSLVSCLIFGNDGAGAPLLKVVGGAVKTGSVLPLILSKYGLKLVQAVTVITMALMISSLFRNSAVAIAVSVVSLLIGNSFISICASLNLDYARYTIFANWDLQSVMEGGSLFAHMTVTGAIINICVHMVIFIWTAHDAFTRKEL